MSQKPSMTGILFLTILISILGIGATVYVVYRAHAAHVLRQQGAT